MTLCWYFLALHKYNMVFPSFTEGLCKIRVLALSLSLLELGLHQGCFRVPL